MTAEPIELPDRIGEEDIFHFEKVLYLLPDGHPDRKSLRDLVVAAISRVFDATPVDRIDRRLALFEEALHLHVAEDFARGDVALAAAPMARWAVETFEQRGDESVVLAASRFLALAEPGDARHMERFRDLADWSESARRSFPDDIERLTSLVELYRRLVSLVPDEKTALHLADLYVERHRRILERFRVRGNEPGEGGDFGMSPFEILRQAGNVQLLPADLVYVFFVIGDPARARSHLADLVREGGVRAEFLDLLEDMAAGRDAAENWFAIAGMLGARDNLAGLRACVKARALDRKDPRFPLCVGRFFEEMGRPEGAVEFYAEAGGLAPDEDMFAELLDLFRRALYAVHADEKAREAAAAVKIADRLVARALSLSPADDSDLRVVTASLLYTAAEVEFDDGRIDEALGHLQRSNEVLENVPALAKLAEVRYLRGAYDEAAAMLGKALAIRREGLRPSAFWRAVIEERMADCRMAQGDHDQALAMYRKALAMWEKIEPDADEAAEAAIRRGVLLDRLGDRAASQDAFRAAVRVDPDRRATYAEILSFLATSDRLEDAAEFYGMAYNQDRIEAMWKIYYSLWMEGLSRRLGKGSFPQAMEYLSHSRGATWQDKLAAYYAGTLTLDGLRAEARNTGQRVEADYYAALLALAGGREDEARTLLEKVIESDLMGFFEYRMARGLLDRRRDTR